jgi:hypothetical protein
MVFVGQATAAPACAVPLAPIVLTRSVDLLSFDQMITATEGAGSCPPARFFRQKNLRIPPLFPVPPAALIGSRMGAVAWAIRQTLFRRS